MKKLLQQLTEAFGPSGYEDNIRKLVQAEVKPLADLEFHLSPIILCTCVPSFHPG